VARKSSWHVIRAQLMRAILLAKATAATLKIDALAPTSWKRYGLKSYHRPWSRAPPSRPQARRAIRVADAREQIVFDDRFTMAGSGQQHQSGDVRSTSASGRRAAITEFADHAHGGAAVHGPACLRAWSSSTSGIDDLIAASYAYLGTYVADIFEQAMAQAGDDPLKRLRAVVDTNFRSPVLARNKLPIWLAFWSLAGC
jgi:hypothetical protein